MDDELTIWNGLYINKKWSKGKVRDKLNNQVLFDKATYEKLLKEVPSYKLITPSVVSERLKVRGSLARRALDELLQKGAAMPPPTLTPLAFSSRVRNAICSACTGCSMSDERF
uniref:40S ribosomal protein S25 n=1 Tax=Timema genevievae TaxID=629358 RepID=A0A7R9PIS6_TIMGE|nr:unnamed protein product [Timema genevievae]